MARKQRSGVSLNNSGMAEEKPALNNLMEPGKTAKCKLCGSDNIVKYGLSKGVQCWWCKDCCHKFVDNKANPGMKLPREQVDFTLSMYYEGMGLTAICRYLKQKYNNCPSDSTVYNWLMRFTEKVIAAAKGDHPRVSDKWIATLTPVKVGTENVWFWDILDVKTRFLLASHVSKKLTSNHARKTFGLAIKKAGKTPRIVLTDQMVLYSKGLEINDSSEADRIRFREFTSSSSARFLQSYSSPLKTREIILRGFKNLKSARTIIRGWAVHYNHLRPDEIIQNNTPAYHAGIRTHIKTKLY